MDSKRNIVIFLSACCLLCVFILSVQGEEINEREAMYYRYMGFVSKIKGGSIQPHWMEDGTCFWYAEDFPDKTVIYKVDPNAGTKEPLFDAV
ncbi:MAG: hypothetical protein JXB23_11980, partial [Candidatus Aminicenantes bacterium]|nr:hypothetical protein [Candidatus Aminicenantes bacterium]